jgi:pimeloyl-ACP methyl ester carboxylesterase
MRKTRTLFLPGAGGSASFWRPVADRTKLNGTLLSWPGLGHEPSAPGVDGLDSMVAIVLRHTGEQVNLVAQSIGGLIAMKAALAAHEKVRRLVLVATSAGVPVKDLGGTDWRLDYYQAYPHAATWVGEVHEDLSDELCALTIPTLLLWGDCDPISPLSVGEHLLSLLPNARLHIIHGGNHDLAQVHAPAVGDLIEQYLLEDGAPDGSHPAQRATG